MTDFYGCIHSIVSYNSLLNIITFQILDVLFKIEGQHIPILDVFFEVVSGDCKIFKRVTCGNES
jgi:hypothetical protein